MQQLCEGDIDMNIKELAEVLSVLNKIQIEINPNLTETEKELYKHFVDEIKNKVK